MKKIKVIYVDSSEEYKETYIRATDVISAVIAVTKKGFEVKSAEIIE